jgi:predicted RNA-binding Zn-ribbon protein involved in translation (DUF1610 family)
MNYYGYTDYGYNDYDAAAGILGGIAIISLIVVLISVALVVLQIISTWKVFKKAGKGGWESLIPFYNNYVLIEISGLNWWWFLISLSPLVLAFIPVISLLSSLASMFTTFNCYYNLSKKFNKGTGFAVCLTLFTPICLPILGLSKNNVYNNVYVSNNGVFGPSSENNSNNNGYNNNYNNMNNNVNYNYQNMQQTQYTNDVNNQNVVNAQPQQFSFCGNCGTKLDSNVRFCPNCGKEKI